jgi:L-ascorbate peroxidase
MLMSSFLSVAFITTFTHASVVQDATGDCPPVWTQVSQDLATLFVSADGQCNDDARAAVRAAFHDCATWSSAQGNTGGCDGSLFLSAEENARSENRGLQDISTKLQAIATQRGVGVADIIAFAGAHATLSCPLGPTVKTMIGRNDSSTAAPDESLLPGNASMSADTIISLFADKGFSAEDVAALVGAHSSAQQRFTDPSKAGDPQDRTPGIWDVDFYNDTTNKPDGVFVFQSDTALSVDPRSGPTFKSFVGQQAYASYLASFRTRKLTMEIENGIKHSPQLSHECCFLASIKRI